MRVENYQQKLFSQISSEERRDYYLGETHLTDHVPYRPYSTHLVPIRAHAYGTANAASALFDAFRRKAIFRRA